MLLFDLWYKVQEETPIFFCASLTRTTVSLKPEYDLLNCDGLVQFLLHFEEFINLVYLFLHLAHAAASAFAESIAQRYVHVWVWSQCGIHSLCLSLGSCRKVTMATQKQLARLWHTTNIYMYPAIHEYAEKLTSLFPDPLKVNWFWQEQGLVKWVSVYKKYLLNNQEPWYLYGENLYWEYRLSVKEHEGPQAFSLDLAINKHNIPNFCSVCFLPSLVTVKRRCHLKNYLNEEDVYYSYMSPALIFLISWKSTVKIVWQYFV